MMAEPSKTWDVLYREHAPALRRYLALRFGRSAPSEDLLQDTFLQAIRTGDRLGEAESPRAWLFGIARHVGLTSIRKRKTLASMPAAVAAEEKPESDPRHEALRSAIDRLPPALRRTLQLRLQRDLSYEEIAAVLGIPVGTVRSRLHNAVRRLRDDIGKNPQRSEDPTEIDS